MEPKKVPGIRPSTSGGQIHTGFCPAPAGTPTLKGKVHEAGRIFLIFQIS